jgi:serine/threonine protein kinase
VRLCLDEDELYRLTHGRTLGETPEAEAHLADCGACSSLLATLLDARPSPERWGALTNQLVGPYLLVGQVGAGAMGAVYRATDTRLGRTVAVKVLAPHARGQLEAEARAAAAIDHPNVVRVYDVGESWVVEELVEGRSLREAIARGKLELAETRRLAVQLARGLEAAHGAGVVHRDLKPENLLVTAEGVLKILDFGLARRLDADEPPGVHGTPGYFSPEQARGERVDARSDLFAAGAIVYELATGRRAFGGADHAQRIAAVLRETPPVDELGPWRRSWAAAWRRSRGDASSRPPTWPGRSSNRRRRRPNGCRGAGSSGRRRPREPSASSVGAGGGGAAATRHRRSSASSPTGRAAS